MYRLAYTTALLLSIYFTHAQHQWADSLYAQMSLDQKIGQLFMIMAHPDGNTAKQTQTIAHIEEQHVGGVLFSKGTSAQQLRDTRTYQIKTAVPLLIAADAEWGMAMRLKDLTPYPYAMTLGALSHPDLVFALGKRLGERKRAMGVHLSFAPVLDVNSESKNPIIGVRSFGDSPKTVAQHGAAFMEGLQAAGIWAVAKHFPGHGAALQDSHLHLPLINRSKKALDTLDLFPFKHLIRHDLKGIMVGHLSIPALTKNTKQPVSVAHEVVTHLLQKQLGFKGLVFTDALNMKGVTDQVKHPSLATFLAGADVLLLPENLTKAIAALKSNYLNGTITEKRLAHSVKKILRAKYELGLSQSKQNSKVETLPFGLVDRYLLREIANQSVVLCHKSTNTFPVTTAKTVAYVALGDQQNNRFLTALREHATVRQLPSQSATTSFDAYATLVVGIHANTSTPWKNQYLTKADRAVLEKLSRHHNVHVVVFAKPYVLRQLPARQQFSSVLLAHQQDDAFAKAAAHVLFGTLKAIGKLPVFIEGF